MFSNQSVSVHESLAPSAHGFMGSLVKLVVMVFSSSNVVTGFTFESSGRYQTTLFEFAFATTPYVVPSTVVRLVHASP
jgi:hypothetical protein